MKLEDLRIYLVRNSSGQYYRTIGRDGYGSCWTDDVKKARIWNKSGAARGRISHFAKYWPQYPVPDLIEITPGNIIVHNETNRVEKAKLQKKLMEARYRLRHQEYLLETAQNKAEEQYRAYENMKVESKKILDALEAEIKGLERLDSEADIK